MMVYIILGEGFEEVEAITAGDILRRGGVELVFAAVGGSKTITGAHNIVVTADTLAESISPTEADYILIPGGMGGVNSIKADKKTMDIIKTAADNNANLAAICAGPSVLASLELIDGRHITCYPGCEELMAGALCDASRPVVIDGSLITGRAPGSAIDFALAVLSAIKGKEVAEKIRGELVY